MLMRLLDYLKADGITGFFTSLTTGGAALDRTDTDVSSLIDTWLILLAIESGGERNRALSILKSRGMAHSNQTREFLLTDDGMKLLDVYVGPDGVLTGSARLAREAEERAAQLRRRLEIERQQRERSRRRSLMEAQITALRLEVEAQEADILALIERIEAEEAQLARERMAMADSRQADTLTETDRTAETRT
jgi:circadian clock protein KaiC